MPLPILGRCNSVAISLKIANRQTPILSKE
jgi:hypothetical protein